MKEYVKRPDVENGGADQTRDAGEKETFSGGKASTWGRGNTDRTLPTFVGGERADQKKERDEAGVCGDKRGERGTRKAERDSKGGGTLEHCEDFVKNRKKEGTECGEKNKGRGEEHMTKNLNKC